MLQSSELRAYYNVTSTEMKPSLSSQLHQRTNAKTNDSVIQSTYFNVIFYAILLHTIADSLSRHDIPPLKGDFDNHLQHLLT